MPWLLLRSSMDGRCHGAISPIFRRAFPAEQPRRARSRRAGTTSASVLVRLRRVVEGTAVVGARRVQALMEPAVRTLEGRPQPLLAPHVGPRSQGVDVSDRALDLVEHVRGVLLAEVRAAADGD